MKIWVVADHEWYPIAAFDSEEKMRAWQKESKFYYAKYFTCEMNTGNMVFQGFLSDEDKS